MEADLVILKANLITMQGGCQTLPGMALAVSNHRIMALDTEAEIRDLIGPRTKILDLAGKTVLPGFIDTHVHLIQTGLSLAGANLSAFRQTDQVLEIVREEAAKGDRDALLFLHRCRLLALDRPLVRSDLDRAAPNRPVVVGDFELHGCVANTKALETALKAGVDLALPGAELEAGSLNGPAHTAFRRFCYDSLDRSVVLEAARAACAQALRAGVTTVHSMEGREAFGTGQMEILSQARESLPLRLVLYFQAPDPDRAVELGVKGIADLWADGAYMDHSAALLEPYADKPGTKGGLIFSQEEINRLAARINARGLQVSFHAVGDAAIDQVLTAYEELSRQDPSFRERIPRIEHFSLPTDEQIERAAWVGAAAAMQPALSAGPQKTVAQRLGEKRAEGRHPYRKILEAGVLVAGGSDSDVTPINPLAGIHAVVNQTSEVRRLSAAEALTLFTLNGALIAGEGEDKGELAPGRLADLAVLGRNPLEVQLPEMEKIPVELTLVGGEVKWLRNE